MELWITLHRKYSGLNIEDELVRNKVGIYIIIVHIFGKDNSWKSCVSKSQVVVNIPGTFMT